MPPSIVFKFGFLFTINNCLAQLANRIGDVPLSIKYLEVAVEASLDARTQNKNEIPIAETFLNLANANCFIG